MSFFRKKRRDSDDTENEAIDREVKELKIKILVIGAPYTGKTSIVQRFVHKFFSRDYKATIGVDFAQKVVHWDENTLVCIQLWDVAGQEGYSNMIRAYYRGAHGALIVCDVTRPSTFEAVTKWHTDLDSKVQLADGSPLPCVLMANKCDQKLFNLIQLKDLCQAGGFLTFFETSAKEDINITEAVTSLVAQILKDEREMQSGGKGRKGKGLVIVDKTRRFDTSERDRNIKCC